MRRNQSAFTLITTLFLLVVLSVIGVYILSLRNVQQQTVVSGLQGSRALQAAYSGLEWGIYRAINNSTCDGSPPPLDFSSAGLTGFRVNVSCRSSLHQEGAKPITVYTFLAIAEIGEYGQTNYIQRRLRMTVSANPP